MGFGSATETKLLLTNALHEEASPETEVLSPLLEPMEYIQQGDRRAGRETGAQQRL